MARCGSLPPGHRHCRHGHLIDCPDPGGCELLPLEPYAWLVWSGLRAWVFGSPGSAAHRVRLLDGEVPPRAVGLLGPLLPAKLAEYVGDLPEGTEVFDMRV